MAAEINFVKVSAAPHPSANAALLSASSLADIAHGLPESLTPEINSLFVRGHDRRDLIWCEALDRAAAGAGILEGFKVSPADRHLELTSAIVRDGHADATIAHGWPILSVSSSHLLTRTEGEGRKSLPGGH